VFVILLSQSYLTAENEALFCSKKISRWWLVIYTTIQWKYDSKLGCNFELFFTMVRFTEQRQILGKAA